MPLPLWQCLTKNSFKIALSDEAVPHNTATSCSPSHRVSPTWAQSSWQSEEINFPWTAPHQWQHFWTKKESGKKKWWGKVVSLSPCSSMNLGQWKIILKAQLSRAILFSCAKKDRGELVLQPVIISTFPYPCFFPQHGTWLQTAKWGFGSESRAAGHTQLPQDR